MAGSKVAWATLAAAVLAAALLAAGCGGSGSSNSGGDTMSASSWADGLCSALGTWSSSVRSASSSLSSHVDKKSLQTAATQIKQATAQLKSDLKNLKRPDTEAGAKAKETVDSLAAQLDADVGKIESSVKSAEKSGGTIQAVAAIGSTLTALSNQVRTAFTNLHTADTKGKLEDAFKNAPSCKKLVG